MKILPSTLILLVAFISACSVQHRHTSDVAALAGTVVQGNIRSFDSLESVLSLPSTRPLDATLLSLTNDFRHLSLSEKTEFTLLVLTSCRLGEGSAVALAELLGEDAPAVSASLSQISNDVLKKDLQLNEDRIHSYRGFLDVLAEHNTSAHSK